MIKKDVVSVKPSSVVPEVISQGLEQGAGNFRLVIKKTGETFNLKANSITTIGRESTNDIAFPEDFSISRRQARIIFEQDDIFIEDLGSTNGTYLNKRRITKKMKLENNDEIKIGKKDFIFIIE